jgi:hypothetical protein
MLHSKNYRIFSRYRKIRTGINPHLFPDPQSKKKIMGGKNTRKTHICMPTSSLTGKAKN